MVSIPFIAGQWSLLPALSPERGQRLQFQSPSLRGSGRFTDVRTPQASERRSFNPLHCGAVVASGSRILCYVSAHGVSIPFIAGQWSLHEMSHITTVRLEMFQSPSLRGSGRFRKSWRSANPMRRRFNPLHCGAVVASEWRSSASMRRTSFNPLHCGAVVASALRLWRDVPPPWGFNPLHCGAVVASVPAAIGAAGIDAFQSPSLRGSGRFHLLIAFVISLGRCFNPLHCGAVVASSPHPPPGGAVGEFQSPSLRGSGRFIEALARNRADAERFNPLHCGAVVASESRKQAEARAEAFQSPSLRGSGRFLAKVESDAESLIKFQSPSLRGSGRFSNPFLLDVECTLGFNPLHCGAVVASGKGAGRIPRDDVVSIPFIAGQWSLRPSAFFPYGHWPMCFNPLHCGAVVASLSRYTYW